MLACRPAVKPKAFVCHAILLIAFPIVNAGRVVHRSDLIVWLNIALYGFIRLGKFGKLDYFGFKCADCSALAVDYPHGYLQGQYYLECHCGYKQLCGDSL